MTDSVIRLFRSTDGPVVQIDSRFYRLPDARWDELFNDAHLHGRLMDLAAADGDANPLDPADLLPPIRRQEVWAAGVTYFRSKAARMDESRDAGGGDFYDRVYDAPRPELFFKATAHRVAGPGQAVRIRSDAQWSVPEPELALAVNASGQIFGYTIGNDMSSRDIEGDNPLYLPQAKVYDQCCGLGPGVLVASEPLPADTVIRLEIHRSGARVVVDQIALTEMKRSANELVSYLFRDHSFPSGCYLLTGTGIIPPDEFTLRPGDRIRITIDPIGTLENHVVQNHA